MSCKLFLVYSRFLQEIKPGINCQCLAATGICVKFQLFPDFDRVQNLQKLEKNLSGKKLEFDSGIKLSHSRNF